MSEPQHLNTDGIGNYEDGIEPQELNPDIAPGFTKALSHLWGWYPPLKLWRKMSLDAQGRLLVSTQNNNFATPNQASTLVLVAGTVLLTVNQSRLGFYLYNVGLNTIQISFNSTLTFTAFTSIPPGCIFTFDNYIGGLSARAPTGNSIVQIIEY